MAMHGRARRLGFVVLALAAGAATVGVASAAGPALRWVPYGRATMVSGAAKSSDYYVGLSAKMPTGTTRADRYYAFRGVQLVGTKGCGLQLVPSFLNPAANHNIKPSGLGCSDETGYSGGTKTAALPKGKHVTALQVCTNKKGTGLKGIRLWGTSFDARGRTVKPVGPVEVKRNGCKSWKRRVACLPGEVANSIRIYRQGRAGISLVCAKVVPDSSPLNPVKSQVDRAVFLQRTSKLSVTVDIVNKADTTAEIKTVSARVGRCSAESKFGFIPTHQSRQIELRFSCSWNQIASASCKLKSSCSAKFVTRITTNVAGTEETASFPEHVTVQKR